MFDIDKLLDEIEEEERRIESSKNTRTASRRKNRADKKARLNPTLHMNDESLPYKRLRQIRARDKKFRHLYYKG